MSNQDIIQKQKDIKSQFAKRKSQLLLEENNQDTNQIQKNILEQIGKNKSKFNTDYESRNLIDNQKLESNKRNENFLNVDSVKQSNFETQPESNTAIYFESKHQTSKSHFSKKSGKRNDLERSPVVETRKKRVYTKSTPDVGLGNGSIRQYIKSPLVKKIKKPVFQSSNVKNLILLI